LYEDRPARILPCACPCYALIGKALKQLSDPLVSAIDYQGIDVKENLAMA